jgi:nucleoside-diphosphate-sugar epimerase
VVLTSSFAAIGYGEPTDQPFSEEDWTDPHHPGLTAYVKSKTLAERAAWDFMTREGGALELSVVNPVGVFGPVLGPDFSSSIQLLRTMMDGGMPRAPRLSFGVVDVRDVADLHLRAMTDPAAKGQRFLAVAGESMSMQEIALLLRARMGEAARRAPTKVMPDWIVRFAGLFNPALAQAVPELGRVRRLTNEKARRLLGWRPRSNEEAILATAESLVRLGLLGRAGGAA